MEENNVNVYGYMRLSKRNLQKVDSNGEVISDEEQLQRQERELLNGGVPDKDHIFNEGIISGVSQNKVVLNKMLGLREYSNSQPLLPIGSTLIVTELSRLSRDFNELQIILSRINALNVKLILLDFPMLNQMNLDDTTSRFLNQMVVNLLAYLADMERQKLIERTKSGIANAVKNGKKLGRPNKVSNPEEISRIFDLYYTQNSITSEMGMKILGVKKTTFFKILKEERCRRFGFLEPEPE